MVPINDSGKDGSDCTSHISFHFDNIIYSNLVTFVTFKEKAKMHLIKILVCFKIAVKVATVLNCDWERTLKDSFLL